MTEEEKKTLIGDLYEKLNKAQHANHHQAVLDHTDKSKHILTLIQLIFLVLQVDSSEQQSWARRASLTALIKTKNFEQALELIKGREKDFAYEHAYILHRLGQNAEALQVIQRSGDGESVKAKHLLAQVVSLERFIREEK